MTMPALGLLALALGIAPSAPGDEITLTPSKGDRLHAAWMASIAQLDRPSERTTETLRRFDVETRYRRDPEGALATLEKLARRGTEPELIYALAELSWIEGKRAEGRRRQGDLALNHYLDTAAYAFDYLFDPDLSEARSAADPRYRLACDLYNAALDRLLHAAKENDGLKPGGVVTLTINGSEQVIPLGMWPETPWGAEDVDELVLASDFEVNGLSSRSRRFGLGVPLVAVKRTERDEAEGSTRFYPPEMAYPLTAILRPTYRLRNAENADVEQTRDCTIDLVDPVQKRTIGQDRDALLIEADVTTPLAYMWSRTDMNSLRWTGLFRPGQMGDRTGLMLLRPYEPGKIPVVMVHGLVSTPLAWIPMLNELLRDPAIHQRYQFLLYLYPTGMPIPIAAADLRDALTLAKGQFDPLDSDPAFDRMVLLGHSMGGLLAHAAAVDSGELFWQMYTYRRFQDVLGPPEVLRELDHYAHFRHLDFVERVVFLATPHRGSEFSRRLVGRVGAGLIAPPDHYSELVNRLVDANPEAFPKRVRQVPTSIETLDPDSPVLNALLKMTPGPDVAFHSIIGAIRPEAQRETTDGIVPYTSAHLDGAASELVIQSDHGVQKDPEAIREVRRILLEHLEVDTADPKHPPPR